MLVEFWWRRRIGKRVARTVFFDLYEGQDYAGSSVRRQGVPVEDLCFHDSESEGLARALTSRIELAAMSCGTSSRRPMNSADSFTPIHHTA